ncbi:MAG: metallophosphoesterase family protein [Bilophila wadsworthia]
MRQLYVGSLAQVTADCFPDNIDYLALGHLHIPQKIGGSETRRYSGSPVPMGFGERGAKSVASWISPGRQASVGACPFCFSGSWNALWVGRPSTRLKAIAAEGNRGSKSSIRQRTHQRSPRPGRSAYGERIGKSLRINRRSGTRLERDDADTLRWTYTGV